MALIPPDAGTRLRMQTEASLQPIAPVKGTGVDLPQLQIGQAFTARILEVQPENTYRALIAGRQMTLSLPEGASAGDTLELVVIDRTSNVVIAKAAPDGEAQPSGPAPNTTLSPAARLISSLLPSEGEAPPAADLTRGQPVLPRPPANGSELAPRLDQAVSRSGLFYESHQAQWVFGQRSVAELRLEPQGQQPPLATSLPQASGQAAALREMQAQPASFAGLQRPTVMQGSPFQDQPAGPNAPLAQALPEFEPYVPGKTPAAPLPAEHAFAQPSSRDFGASPASARPLAEHEPAPQAQVGGHTEALELRSSTPSALSTQADGTPTPRVADDLKPLVQQQLDAVATQRLAWHGEVWPGQAMDWEIRWEDAPRDRGTSPESGDGWSTTLSLTTPRLGRVDAALQLAGGGVRIRLATPFGASAADLRDALPSLASALEAAGVPLIGAQVQHEEA